MDSRVVFNDLHEYIRCHLRLRNMLLRRKVSFTWWSRMLLKTKLPWIRMSCLVFSLQCERIRKWAKVVEMACYCMILYLQICNFQILYNYMRTKIIWDEVFCVLGKPGLRHSILLPIGFNYLSILDVTHSK